MRLGRPVLEHAQAVERPPAVARLGQLTDRAGGRRRPDRRGLDQAALLRGADDVPDGRRVRRPLGLAEAVTFELVVRDGPEWGCPFAGRPPTDPGWVRFRRRRHEVDRRERRERPTARGAGIGEALGRDLRSDLRDHEWIDPRDVRDGGLPGGGHRPALRQASSQVVQDRPGQRHLTGRSEPDPNDRRFQAVREVEGVCRGLGGRPVRWPDGGSRDDPLSLESDPARGGLRRLRSGRMRGRSETHRQWS